MWRVSPLTRGLPAELLQRIKYTIIRENTSRQKLIVWHILQNEDCEYSNILEKLAKLYSCKTEYRLASVTVFLVNHYFGILDVTNWLNPKEIKSETIVYITLDSRLITLHWHILPDFLNKNRARCILNINSGSDKLW